MSKVFEQNKKRNQFLGSISDNWKLNFSVCPADLKQFPELLLLQVKKGVLFPEICLVKKFLSLTLTRPHIRMSIKIYVLMFKKQTNKQKNRQTNKQNKNTKKVKETKEEKKISRENWIKRINLRPPGVNNFLVSRISLNKSIFFWASLKHHGTIKMT